MSLRLFGQVHGEWVELADCIRPTRNLNAAQGCGAGTYPMAPACAEVLSHDLATS